MIKPKIAIFDVETQKQTIREMNDEEYNQYLLDLEEVAPAPELN